MDGASAFGRGIIRGAMQYVNAQRRWEIYSVLRGTFDPQPPKWTTCDGAILAGVGEPLISRIQKSTKHVITCSGSASAEDPAVVCLDDPAAGALAAEHLMECRVRTFGYYGVPTSRHSVNRLRGFSDALQKRQHSCIECPVSYHPRPDKLEHWPALIAWVRDLPKPAGILAVDDAAAYDLAAACRHADIAVPEHVAIVGVNNDDLLCETAWPPLSSVDAGYTRVGYTAALLLDRLLQGEKLKPEDCRIRVPPLQVVKRLSTDVLAVDEPDVAEAVRYIREHACDPCSVDDILRHVATGRRWLERQFVKKLGRTPREEIERVQLETAKRLLLQPGLTLPVIAERCGFSGGPTFGRAFVRVVGSTPAAYRRNALRPAN